jgi:CubicO group peptidase (beta-lactamase class C family)
MGRAKAVAVRALLVGALVGGWGNDAAADDMKADATATSARSSAPLPPRLRARLGAAVHRGFRQAAAPGVVVGVQTPKGRWVKAIGIANERSKAPMRAKLHHRIGSVTKTFMGALLMQLAGEHKLSLDDKVSQYIEGVPSGDTMTLAPAAGCRSSRLAPVQPGDRLSVLRQQLRAARAGNPTGGGQAAPGGAAQTDPRPLEADRDILARRVDRAAQALLAGLHVAGPGI